jgi:cysteine desulfurase
MIYLDYAATTPVDERVFEVMRPYFCEVFANPSSKHRCGRKASAAVHKAREQVAGLVGAKAKNVIFTGGASEASNLAIKGITDALECEADDDEIFHFITSEFEHKASLNAMKALEDRGHEVTFLAPNEDGIITAQSVAEAIRPNTVMISLIHVNNEIGTISPIREIGEIADANGIVFHVDATQSFGKMPIDFDRDRIDLLSLSAHKIYGPKGIGALITRDDVPLKCQISGGSQEGGIRAGTLNVPGIVGLGEAARIAGNEMEQEWDRLEDMETAFLQFVRDRIGGVHLQGAHQNKVPWITNICFEGVDGGELRDALGKREICVSRSSACAKSNAASHVLAAIGCPPELSGSAIRFSFGRRSNYERLEAAVNALEDVVTQMRSPSYSSSSPLPAAPA